MEEYFDEKAVEGEGFDFSRYVKAFGRRWWLVLIIFLGISVPWLLYLKQLPPMYQADVWISFEDAGTSISESLIQKNIMILQSRSFAEEVTAELGLAVEIINEKDQEPLSRQDLFRTVSTTQNPAVGLYTLMLYPTGDCSFYHEKTRLDSASIETFSEDTVHYNNISFSLNPEIQDKRSVIHFRVNNFQNTVKSLRSRERIENSRTGDLMHVIFSDRDPMIASQTVNMLADIFIRKSIEMDQQRTAFQSNYIKEQMEVIQKELSNSDSQWKSFRGSYLQGLDQTTKTTYERLKELDASLRESKFNKDQLQLLLGKLDPSSVRFEESVSPSYVYRQLTKLPLFDNDQDMALMRRQLDDLDKQKAEMLQAATLQHPDVIALSENIAQLEGRVYSHAKATVKIIDTQIQDTQNSINEIEHTLGILPSEELRQIGLERQRKSLEESYQMYLKRLTEAQISEAVPMKNVSKIDSAALPDKPVSANKQKKAAMGLAAALFLGAGTVVVMEIADKRIRTREDIKRYLKLSMLGIIPKVKFDDYELQDSEKAKSISSQIVTHDYSPTPVGEAYRSLRTNILFSKSFGPVRSMAIGSVAPGEGKSFTATNLAITLAQQKTKTLLIDADLRRGVLHNTFNCPKKPGLTNYLTGVAPLESVLNETYIPNLTLITCGSMIPNPSELLGSVRMKQFIEGIASRFDFILFDTPPLMAATDAIILATLVDGIAVLIRAGQTNREDVQKKLELFRHVDVKVMGAILNCAGAEVAHDGYSYYRY